MSKEGSAAGPPTASTTTTAMAIAAYATCSSLMLVINKVAVHNLPAPSVVLFFQLLSSAAVVWVLGKMGVLQSEPLEWQKVKAFMLVVLAFLGAIFTNMKTLQYANVDTFIVFRSSTPLVISLLDYMFLGRALPSLRSWASLLVILAGAGTYVATDADFRVDAYMWVISWVVIFCFDQVYIKFVCDTVPMTSWGRVYYTNLLALPPVICLGLIFNEQQVLAEFEWTSGALMALTGSCLAGVGMSYSAFWLRSIVSATSFTVVGIMCKIGTVAINCVIWDKHASGTGLAALMVCLLAGTAYQQAPMRSATKETGS